MGNVINQGILGVSQMSKMHVSQWDPGIVNGTCSGPCTFTDEDASECPRIERIGSGLVRQEK